MRAAIAVDPPSCSNMSVTVAMQHHYDKRSTLASETTKSVAESRSALLHDLGMITHADLLQWLHARRDAGELANSDLQTLLKLPSSRITEIFNGKRQIKLDEAKAIVDHYDLEAGPRVAQIPSEALAIVLEELLRQTEGRRPSASTLRPLAEGLSRGLQLLADNPAIHANMDAVKAVAQALAVRPPAATPGA
jgi:hypothetical protein